MNTYKRSPILRGDILYAELGAAAGSEQAGFRPVVVIQNDVGNHYVRYILYEPFKSAEDAAAFIRTILKEHHVHIKTAAADDIALCREKYNLLKRKN